VSVPSRVVQALLKHHTIPDELVKLIYWLMVREEEKGYPALNPFSPDSIKDDDAPVLVYTQAFDLILNRLPKYGEGAFKGTIHDLSGMVSGLLYLLGTMRVWAFPTSSVVGKDAVSHELWRDFLSYRLAFTIPTKARFEHTHIIGATGSGKTQLIQRMIAEDLETDASVIVMAPKGAMIPTLSKLRKIDSERLIIIRPEDPIALNIFDVGSTETDAQTNNAVGLINYIFSSILDAETTSKQTALLNYSIRLLLKAKGSTLLTLRSLLREPTVPDDLKEYLPSLSNSAQEFFQHQFHNKKIYGETKEQILWRLDLLLENSLIERIFSQKETRLNLKAEMERGKVILIDTSIAHLGEFGSSFLGRFFIALVALASQQRDPTKPLRPVWFYIDEASTYLSAGMIESILERSRESRIGLILAHQSLSQLNRVSAQLESSVHTNTSVKIVGGCSHSDALTLSKELGVEAHSLQSQKPLHFTIKVKGHIPPTGITVKAGYVENLEQREDLENVLRENRARYGAQEEKRYEPSPDSDDDIEDFNRA